MGKFLDDEQDAINRANVQWDRAAGNGGVPMAQHDPSLYQSVQPPRPPAPAYDDTPQSPDMGGYSPLTQQQQQPRVTQRNVGVLKRMLLGGLTAMSQSMIHNAGALTPDEQAQLQAETQYKRAQTGLAMQQAQSLKAGTDLVDTPFGPMPQNSWNKFGPEYIKSQTQQAVANRKAAAAENIAKFNNMLKGLNIGAEVGMDDDGNLKWNNIPDENLPAGVKAKLQPKPTASKVDPIIESQLGPRPDPVKDPEGSKKWGYAAELIKNRMAAAPRIAGADESARNTPFATFDENGNFAMSNKLAASRAGLPDAKAFQSLYGPTSQTKSAGQAAGAVSSHIPEFKQSIQALAETGDLGPVMGRINDYVNKGYGGSDPRVAAFVANVKLLKSGTVRAHFGARGGQQILESFDNLLNTAQTPEALVGSVDAIGKWLNTYGDVGQLKGPKTSIKAGGGASTNQKPIEQFSPSRNAYRYSLDGGKTWQNGRAPSQ